MFFETRKKIKMDQPHAHKAPFEHIVAKCMRAEFQKCAKLEANIASLTNLNHPFVLKLAEGKPWMNGSGCDSG